MYVASISCCTAHCLVGFEYNGDFYENRLLNNITHSVVSCHFKSYIGLYSSSESVYLKTNKVMFSFFDHIVNYFKGHSFYFATLNDRQTETLNYLTNTLGFTAIECPYRNRNDTRVYFLYITGKDFAEKVLPLLKKRAEEYITENTPQS